MEKRFFCKAILNKETSSNLRVDWAVSRRCLLKISHDYIEVSGQKVLFSEISSASMRIVPSAFFLPGCILTIATRGGSTHHFGLRYGGFWRKELPFPTERSKATVPLLWLRRVLVIGVLAWLIWTMFGK